MCFEDKTIEYKKVYKDNPIIGYRVWRVEILDVPTYLESEHVDYQWPTRIISHKVTESNSGIYSYSHCNYNNYYYNYNYYYCNYNNYYNNYYYIAGIIHQYGKVAIHEMGCRSQYAKIKTLFTIREDDSRGPVDFLNWIKKFNKLVAELAEKYEANTVSWQDFLEQNNASKSNQ